MKIRIDTIFLKLVTEGICSRLASVPVSYTHLINGAATSLGRVPIVLDIFAERDLARGTFTESEIQEFVDDFVMKLRTVK